MLTQELLQIEEKSLNEFSLLMFSDLTARHSGDYTCRVSNHAATVNYTATLSVKGKKANKTQQRYKNKYSSFIKMF